MGYVLRTERLRIVERNDKGNVTARKRFKRGDVVTKSDFADPDRFNQLVASGALIEQEKFNEADEMIVPAEVLGKQGVTGGSTEGRSDGGAVDPVDPPEDFTSYDYPTLQQLAKERTGDGSGGRDALIERLEEHRDADSDEDPADEE